jgi:hypothetical protein
MADFTPLDFNLTPNRGTKQFRNLAPTSGIIPTIPSGYGTTPQQTDTLGGGIGKNSPLIPGLEVLGNLAGAYTGLKQFGLAEEAFKFNKALTKRNLSNQATVTNQAIKDKLRAAAIQRGGGGGSAGNVVEEQLKTRRVQGTL